MKRVALVMAVLLAQGAWAQVTLKQLLEAADEKNVDRLMSEQQRLKAEAEGRQAWTGLLPSLTAQGVWTNNQYDASFDVPDTTTTPPTIRTLTILPKNQLDGVLRFDLPLVDTMRWARIAASGDSTAAAGHREQMTRDLVKKGVVSAYYGYAAALAVRESAQKSVGVAEAQLKLMEVRKSVGQLTELDLLRSKAEVERNRQIVADTEAAVANTRRMLRTLTGLDPGDSAALPQADPTAAGDLTGFEDRVEQLPSVLAADRDSAAATKTAWGARLLLVPTVGAQFTERFTNATGFAGEPSVYTAGMTLTWRLDVPTVMGFGSVRAMEETAKLAADKARDTARDQVHSDWQRLNAALKKTQSAAAMLEAAQRAAEVAKDRYEAGAATQLEVIQAERDLFMAEVGQIQARTEAASARAALRLDSGMPLEGDAAAE